MIRVLIVDDVPLFRVGLRLALDQMSDCDVIGEATHPADILQVVGNQHPDVILLNQGLTSTSALDIARQLFQGEQRGVFVLADPLTEENLFQYLVAGAAAYEPRWISVENLERKLWRVSSGEYLISGETLETLRPARQHLFPPPALAPEPLPCPLTPHETRLLVAIAQGMSNKQIAYLFALSEPTVQKQIASLLRTVGVDRRTAAVMKALQMRWLDMTRIEEDIAQDVAQGCTERARPRTQRNTSRPAQRSVLVRVPPDTQVGYRLQTAYCGKASCKKCRAGEGHGPYWYAYQQINGQSVRRYIGKALPTEVESAQAVALHANGCE